MLKKEQMQNMRVYIYYKVYYMLSMNKTRTDRERQTECDKNVTHVANV